MYRCRWSENTALETGYHDNEWGVPQHDDQMLFEMLTLESAQAGLSWSTILAKREGYRTAFDQFDATKIAQYDEAKYEALLTDARIVRNKLKIRATIENAKRFLEIQEEYGSFDTYIWSFVDGQPIDNAFESESQVPATTEISDLMSKSLKKKGFKFVGSTTCYAFMQAVGMVNDHVTSCFRYAEIKVMSGEKE